MSPFLFIIATEGLHVAVNNLVRRGLFKCANINQVQVSHLFYADDVMLVGNWSKPNLEVISKAFKFFYYISGLKINFEKSSIIGIGVEIGEVNQMAHEFGCKAESLPFKYLGIPIGGSPKRIAIWKPIISKFEKRRATWKANMLSIGGRSTLISSVLGSLGIYFFSIFRMPKKVNQLLESICSSFFWGSLKQKRKLAWVKWGTFLASKDDGGIGFGSIDAMNQALLYRWRWRALDEPHIIWVKVLQAIHGDDCFSNLYAKNKGLWHSIIESIKYTHENSNLKLNYISRKLRNGSCTKFWTQAWCDCEPLDVKFPRLAALDLDKNCVVSDRHDDSGWIWKWRRPIRTTREIEQVNQLISMLPSNLVNEDHDKWGRSFSGKSYFSIVEIRKSIDHYCLMLV
uniref:uncharacterized protein LOC122601047 n=1 Tax=Erigeron canadensis TaxID=72917 RepID=UPI001CB9A2AF|nr:uncharacterized protein LOC122601047 [Erigeron canadensis]